MSVVKYSEDISPFLGEWAYYVSGKKFNEYFQELLDDLNLLYDKKKMYPKKKDVFYSFQKLDPHEIRVVVIGGDPSSKYYEGVAFATKDDQREFNVEEDRITYMDYFNYLLQEYDGIYDEIDHSLERWMIQGILPLHLSLTGCDTMEIEDHRKAWRPFIESVVYAISNYSTVGTIFVLIGEEAKELEDCINNKRSMIIHVDDPLETFDVGILNFFEEADKIIELENDDKIYWK